MKSCFLNSILVQWVASLALGGLAYPQGALPAKQSETARDTVSCCSEVRAILATLSNMSSVSDGIVRVPAAQKQLFLDNHVLARLEKVKRTLHQPKKYGTVIRPDKPWEGGGIQIRTGPSWNPETKTWMMWYGGGLATSQDGIHWEKPILGLQDFKGSKQNNLIPPPVTSYTIFYDRNEPNPGRRYKGLAPAGPVHVRGGGFYPAVSPDGRAWKVLKTSFIPSSDEWHLFHDEQRRLYVATVKQGGPYGRSVYLSVSKDFEHWTDPRDCLIFHADKRDQELGAQRVRFQVESPDLRKPVVNRPEEYRTDIYNLPIFAYEGIYVGMPTVYNSSGLVFDNSDGFNMVELAAGRDLVQWERVGGREKFLPLSPVKGDTNYDTGQLLAANYPIIKDDQIWIYYSGLRWRTHPEALEKSKPGPHGMEFYSPGDSGAICLAKLRLDGFVSLDAGPEEGSVLTKPLILEGKDLYVNLEAPAGEVRAEIVDAASQKPLPGFSLRESSAVRGDRLDGQISWGNSNLASLAGKTVRLRFSLRNASLYAFWVK